MVFHHRSSEVLKGPHKLKHCNQHRKVTLSWDKWTKFISFLTPPWTINTCFNGICSFLFFFLCISFHCCHCYYHYYHHEKESEAIKFEKKNFFLWIFYSAVQAAACYCCQFNSPLAIIIVLIITYPPLPHWSWGQYSPLHNTASIPLAHPPLQKKQNKTERRQVKFTSVLPQKQ